MEEYQFHFGKKFYLDKKTGYWISTTCPKIRAHCWVWIQYNGEIPKGHQIHHLDENKSNNLIENLQLLNPKQHMNLHFNKERRRRQKLIAEKIRPLSKEWHKSEEGRRWHTEHGIKTWEKRKVFTGICKICSSQFRSKTYHQEFCSNKCKSQWRRNQKIDNVFSLCKFCNTKFSHNKYSKRIFCSKSCSFKNTWKKKKNLKTPINGVLSF